MRPGRFVSARFYQQYFPLRYLWRVDARQIKHTSSLLKKKKTVVRYERVRILTVAGLVKIRLRVQGNSLIDRSQYRFRHGSDILSLSLLYDHALFSSKTFVKKPVVSSKRNQSPIGTHRSAYRPPFDPLGNVSSYGFPPRS